MVGYVADGAAGMVILCDDIEEVQVVVDFYRAEIPERERVRFFKRNLLSAILNNWGEGLDRAQEWKRTLGKDDVQK